MMLQLTRTVSLLHSKNEENRVSQYLCTCIDESAAKREMAEAKEKSIDLMEESDKVAIRSYHKEPTRKKNI